MIDHGAILTNQGRMERERSSYDSVWGEIAQLVYPELARFNGVGRGINRWQRQQVEAGEAHDPYTAMALVDGVSLFESYVMPKGQRWQKLELADSALMAKVSVQQWLEQVEIRLFGLRNDPESGFVGATHESAMSLFAFGPQSLWVDKRYDVYGNLAGLTYESEFIGDIWVDRDAGGRVLRIHRMIELTAEQATIKWGMKVPECVRKANADSNRKSDTTFKFLHVIEPNRRWDGDRIDMMGMPWHGCYHAIEGDETFLEGGYRSLPRLVSSFSRAGMSTYGRSPTLTVLPLVRVSQAMMIDRTWAAELALKHPLLTVDGELDDMVLELRPHGVTEGGLNDRGEPMIKEFLTQANSDPAEKLTAEARAIIDRVFFRDLMQLNREYKTHIPAARIEEERAEKGTLLAPLARQEQEWLSPMTQRELALMAEAGMLADAPGDVAEYLKHMGSLGIRYDNGLTSMQEAGKSAAFLSFAGQIGALAQFDQSIVTEFKRDFPTKRFIPELARIAGVPASMRATEEEQAAWDEKQAQDAAQQQLLQAAPVLASAAKDAAAAGSMGGGQPALPAPMGA